MKNLPKVEKTLNRLIILYALHANLEECRVSHNEYFKCLCRFIDAKKNEHYEKNSILYDQILGWAESVLSKYTQPTRRQLY